MIRDTIAKWLAASKEGDIETLTDILHDEMLFVVQSRPPFGKTEFLAEAGGKPFHFEASADIAELFVNGDWALTRLNLTVEIAPTKEAPVMRLAGPVMSVWQKSSDGAWKLWRDANMVVPLARE